MCKPFIKTDSEDRQYVLSGPVSPEEIIYMAKYLLQKRYRRGATMKSPEATREYFRLRLAEYEYEVFAVLFLDNRHRVIALEEMFRGTIDGASVHPREVVRMALKHNAAAVIFAHNHPSGIAEPSQSDRNITRRLQESLSLIDVRVLDHLVIGESEIVSFAERGLV